MLPSLSPERHRKRQLCCGHWLHSNLPLMCVFLTCRLLTPGVCCHIGNGEKDSPRQSFRFLAAFRLQEVEKVFHPRLRETEGGKTRFQTVPEATASCSADSPTLSGRAAMALSFNRRRDPSFSIVSADQPDGSLQGRGGKKPVTHWGFHGEQCPGRGTRSYPKVW